MGAGDEEGVPLPAAAAAGDDELVAVAEHLAEHLAAVGVLDDGPRGHREDDVLAGAPGLVRALPVLPALGDPAVAVRVVEEGGEVGVAADEDVAPAAPLTPVRAAERDELLAAERGRAGPAGSRLDADDCPIDEHARPIQR
jgi:hypothetical protein